MVFITLSFREAFEAKESGALAWDKYLHHLLARAVSIQQDEEREATLNDRFGHTIWRWRHAFRTAVKEGQVKITDLEAVFDAYQHESLDLVQARMAAVHGEARKGVQQALMMLALQDRRPKALQAMLEQREVPFEWEFIMVSDEVDGSKDPKTLEVLDASEFRKQFKRVPLGGYVSSNPAVVFDRGGKLPVHW